eukprot:8163617-Ditylum_brightwellii.AAC.1
MLFPSDDEDPVEEDKEDFYEKEKKMNQLWASLMTAVENTLYNSVKKILDDIMGIKIKSRYLHELKDNEVKIIPSVLNTNSSEDVITRTQTTTTTTTNATDGHSNTFSTTKTMLQTTTLSTMNNDCEMDCDVGGDKVDFKVKINSGKGAKIQLKHGLMKLVDNVQKSGMDFESGDKHVGVINCCNEASHAMIRGKEATAQAKESWFYVEQLLVEYYD